MTDNIHITNCSMLAGATGELQENVYVAIGKTDITDIGPMARCPEKSCHTQIDAGGKLLMPGLINCHNHCAMTLFRGLADDLELQSWLHDHIFPAETAHLSAEMVYWCTKLAAAEMLLSGTTAVVDGYFFMDQAVQSLLEAGLRVVGAHGVIDYPTPSVPDPKKNIERAGDFIKTWQYRSPRISPAVFAHSPYTCSAETLVQAKDLADSRQVPFFIHIAESRDEQQRIMNPHGATPITHLSELGILDENCHCVHSIWLNDLDLDILAGSGAAVITCPQSNLKLASGVARVQEMLDRSIRVGLGTDGCASNNSLDMFREMDMLAKIQKAVTGEATAMSARDVLHCATRGGAEAVGLKGCGEIAVGAPADMILVDTAVPHLTPFYNQDLLVYGASGSDVRTVIVDGQLVVHDRRILTFDLDEVYYQVGRFSDRLRATKSR